VLACTLLPGLEPRAGRHSWQLRSLVLALAASFVLCGPVAPAAVAVVQSGPWDSPDAGDNPLPVRSNSPWGLALIAEGSEGSSSFRALVERLRETHLIVYVEPVWRMPGVMAASTSFLGGPADFRYLRVSVDVRMTRRAQVAYLAHELQHATEIADAPEVVDAATLETYYRRVGEQSVDGYDTPAARAMGLTVWNELWDRRPTPETPN
jgi:hypothetical protein